MNYKEYLKKEIERLERRATPDNKIRPKLEAEHLKYWLKIRINRNHYNDYHCEQLSDHITNNRL